VARASMKGTKPGKPGRPSRVAVGGRVCAASGCSTRLSQYNLKDRCWQHTEIVFPNYRGRRLAGGEV
jgi:hypothetical protein